MSVNLSGMSSRELKALKRKIDKEMEKRIKDEKKKAREALRKTAKEHGFSLNELVGGSKGRSATAAAKYRHPEDTGKTWSGKGRQPNWVKEWLAKGRKLADLQIGK